MTSAVLVLVLCSTNSATCMKPHWKQVKSKFNLCPLYVYMQCSLQLLKLLITTSKVTFTSILYPQFIYNYMIYSILSLSSYYRNSRNH